MAAQLDIYNGALGRLRVKKVTDTDPLVDTSKQAQALDREYITVRNKALTKFPWSFATQRIELQEYNVDNPGVEDPEPLGIWVGRYKLFDSHQAGYQKVLKIIEVRSSVTGLLLDFEWSSDKDEGGDYQQWIFAESTSAIVVTAIVEQTSTSEWPEYFVDHLMWSLAASVCMDLTDSADKQDRCDRMAAVSFIEAREIDMAQKRMVPRLRIRPHWSPMAARLGTQLAPVEGEVA